MSYRIHVQPEASSLLRTLPPHVVLRLGRALGEIAELLTAGQEVQGTELRVEDATLRIAIDRAQELVRLVCVEPAGALHGFPEGAPA